MIDHSAVLLPLLDLELCSNITFFGSAELLDQCSWSLTSASPTASRYAEYDLVVWGQKERIQDGDLEGAPPDGCTFHRCTVSNASGCWTDR